MYVIPYISTHNIHECIKLDDIIKEMQTKKDHKPKQDYLNKLLNTTGTNYPFFVPTIFQNFWYIASSLKV